MVVGKQPSDPESTRGPIPLCSLTLSGINAVQLRGWLLVLSPALWPVSCYFWFCFFFGEGFFSCQKGLSVCERICNTAPGEEWLFHPVSKPSQRDKFCCFCFVCEFFFFFPHSSIHRLKQWGQCWPAENGAIHVARSLNLLVLAALRCWLLARKPVCVVGRSRADQRLNAGSQIPR